MKVLKVFIDEIEYVNMGLTSNTITFYSLKEKIMAAYLKGPLIHCKKEIETKLGKYLMGDFAGTLAPDSADKLLYHIEQSRKEWGD